MKFNVKVDQFCALSKENSWQAWLQSVADDLHTDLLKFLNENNSCSANQKKMKDIYRILSNRNLSKQMIKFLVKNYPNVVEEVAEAGDVVRRDTNSIYLNSIDNKEIFEYYNPLLLTFPQKVVIENDDRDSLMLELNYFISDKFGVDFVVVDNMAYIEYFKKKYVNESNNFPNNSREIYKYKLRKGIV